MIIIPLWFIFFQQNESWGFVVSLFIIMAMLVTNTLLWIKSFSQTVNWYEWVSMRVGFSMYSGWVTAATVLNAFIMLKSLGGQTLGGVVTEEQLAIGVLWTVYALYAVGTFVGKNPAYGSILIWVAIAIGARQSSYSDIVNSSTAIAIIQGIEMVAYWAVLGTMAYYNVGETSTASMFYGL